MDLCSARTEAERRQATYEEIKTFVTEHNDGMKVSNLYIAQVKAKYGIIERENYNMRKAMRRMDCLQANSTTAATLENANSQGLPKSDDARRPKCPKEKEEAIVEALKFFQMI